MAGPAFDTERVAHRKSTRLGSVVVVMDDNLDNIIFLQPASHCTGIS
jgi:hypothetical protein